MKNYLKTLILGVGAGFCIGLAAIAYLTQGNKTLGAFLFTVGLLTILIFKFTLFTGIVGNITENLRKKNWAYLLYVGVVWIGNFIGTFIASVLGKSTRLAASIIEKCDGMVLTKLNDGWLSLIVLGIFCGIMMFVAVDTFKKNIKEKDFLCVAAVFMGVMVFILAGFEHSIADMFYFMLTGKLVDGIGVILLVTLGNAIGANIIPLFHLAVSKLEE